MSNSKIIKNGLYLYILNFFSTVMPMLTLPYVTRVLGLGEYGKFSIAFNIVNYFQVLVEYGFALYGSRKVAVARDSTEINKIFSEILIARMGLFGLSIMFSACYVLNYIENNEVTICILILFLMVLGSVFQQNWLLQGIERMQYITIIGIVSRLISVVCIFLFVKSEQDIYLYCFCYAFTNFCIGIGGFLFVKCKLGIRFIGVNLSDITRNMKEAAYTFISQMGAKILVASGVTILGIIDTESSVGVYSALNKVPNVIILLFTPISQAIYPHISKQFLLSFSNGIKCVMRIAVPTLLFFAIIVGGIIYKSEIVGVIVLGNIYEDAKMILITLMIWALFSILNNFCGIQILVASNHSREYGVAFLGTTFLAVILNVLLIKKYKCIGAAGAILISEIILFILLMISIILILLTNRFKTGKEKDC